MESDTGSPRVRVDRGSLNSGNTALFPAAASLRSRQYSYPLSFRGQVCENSKFSPMFPVNGSLHMAPLFPRSGPGESGSPMS